MISSLDEEATLVLFWLALDIGQSLAYSCLRPDSREDYED